MKEVTAILSRIDSGDPNAASQLLPLVYEELRNLAIARISEEKPGQTLQATALVHEAYLRLVGDPEQHWSGRAHFFGAAAEAMRRILVESARRKKSKKRGGDRARVPLEEGDAIASDNDDLLALDEALAQLESQDPLAAKIVNLRYFAGLTMPQVAETLGISLRTAERNWTYAKSWLHAAVADN